ncbi:MAG: hypothetical protein EPN36_14310 [Rhodanobacteraceae bacterium]|nr:MAG: hypothetical protein EPN36_14310 [Rhodanobacteraceae bacterium]
MSDKSPDYRRGAEDASAFMYDIHARVDKAATAGAERILAKMHEHPNEPVYAYFTKPGEADSEVIAMVRGDEAPPDARPICAEAIERVPTEYLYGFLYQRLRTLPMLASDAKH